MRLSILFLLAIVSSASAQYGPYIPKPKDADHLQTIQTPPQTPSIQYRGNNMVDEHRLRTTVGTESNPEIAASKLLKAYQAWGYTLASVEGQKGDQGSLILINEGVLRKVSIYGLGWWDTFMLRSTLLPYDIFNLPHLEEALVRWQNQHPGVTIQYELVARERSEKRTDNPLTKFLTASEGLAKQRDRSTNELRIYVKKPYEVGGIDFGVGYSSSNGLELQTKYGKKSTFVKDDFFRGKFMLGLARRSTIDPAQDGTMFYSNSELGLTWFTPPIASRWFRLVGTGGMANENEQRPDLPIDRYRLLTTQFGAGIAGEWRPRQYAYLVSGYQLHHVYGEDLVPSAPFSIGDDMVSGPTVTAGVDLMLSEPRPNRLLNDYVRSSLLYQYRQSGDHFAKFSAEFQKVFFTKNVTYLIQSEALWEAKDVVFFDELQLTDLGMPASFDRQFWIRRALNAEGEVRFNIYGDDIQIGLFLDAAPFGDVDRTTGKQDLAFAVAFGPSFYVTLVDSFQLNFNFATGLSTPGDRSYNFNLGFDKIF